MIAYLNGIVFEKRPPQLILNVNGVGYEIFVPLSIYNTIPDVGCSVSLRISYVQKEDYTRLYGFNTFDEKNLFELLLSVNGVGDKSALKFLNNETPATIVTWISNEDLDSIIKLPGLGKKTATKLLLDIHGKLVLPSNPIDDDDDAVIALIALGYSKKFAKEEIQKVYSKGMSTQAIIKAVISNLS